MLAMRFYCLWILLPLVTLGCEREPLEPSANFSVSRSLPSAPSDVIAVAPSYNQIDISWRDNSSNETGFELYRSTGSSGAFSLLASIGANTTSYSDAGLNASTQYCYDVRAVRRYDSKISYSAFSNTACATTPQAPVLAAAPSGVSAAFDLVGAIRITWIDNSTTESGFRVERSAESSGPWTTVVTTAPNAVSFRDERLPAIEQWACYHVFAFNEFGDSPESNVACTAWPRAPSDLVATVTGSDVDLAWTDNSGVEDGFEVMRWPDGSGERLLATLPANTTTYHDAGLADGVYWYQVRVMKDGHHGGSTSNVWVLVSSTPPVTPVGVEARPNGSNIAFVTWIPSQTNEAGFRVERSMDGGASWTVAFVTGMRTSGVEDLAQPSEQLLCYRVTAFNAVGESPPSPTACTALPLGPTNLVATVADGPAVDLSWTDHSAIEGGYEVLRWFAFCDVDSDGFYYCDSGYQTLAFLGPNVTSYRDVSVSAGTSFSYFVVATRDRGRSDWSNEATATVP